MNTDLLSRAAPEADYRLQYGKDRFQFGDLWLPSLKGDKRAPVVVFLHGGWWKAQYGLEYGGHLCSALKADGIALWSIEYRRVGDEGGGWPGTFLDVAAGFDFLRVLGESYALDLERVIVVGHSAGGHLAFWLAGRLQIPPESPLWTVPSAVTIRAVIGLAAAVDLQLTIELAGELGFAHDAEEVIRLMGSSPAAAPERYRAGDPGELLPLRIPQFLLQGTEDDQIPAELPERWADRGRRMGEQVVVEMIAGADHYDLVDPESDAWAKVREAILKALR